MDNRKWHYDLSRRFDGSFGILGGSGYDKETMGRRIPCPTPSRGRLFIAGPPDQAFQALPATQAALGNESRQRLSSFEAVPDVDGNKQDLSGETLAKDSSMQLLRRFHGSEQPTDDEIRRLIHHQEHNEEMSRHSKHWASTADISDGKQRAERCGWVW